MPDQSIPQVSAKVWTEPDVLKRAESFVLEQLAKVLADHDSRTTRWLEFDKVYQNLRDRKVTDGAANITDPEPFVIVNTLVSNIVEAFFSQEPPFKYVGAEKNDDEQAEIMTAYRAEHIRRIGLREKFQRSIQQLITFGTTVVKTPWRKEVTYKTIKQRIKVTDPMTGFESYQTVSANVPFPKYDETDWEFVSLFDFYPIGNGSNIDDLDGCIHKIQKTYDELKANERKEQDVDGVQVVEGVYYNLDALHPLSSPKVDILEYSGRIPYWIVTGEDKDRYVTFEGIITVCVSNLNVWKKDQLQSQREIKGGGLSSQKSQENKGNRTAVIRCQENALWSSERPYMVCQWETIDNDFYGIGAIQPIKELWDELNDTRNQLIDNKTLMLRMPMLEDVHANLQRNVHLTGPNARIKCDDINGVKPLPIQNFQAEGWRNVAAIKDDMRRATAAVESLQGVPLSGTTSATEFSAVQQQAGVRLKNKIKLIDEKLFKKFLEVSYQMDMQFAEFERVIKVVGEKGAKFQRVKPEDIWGNFDVVTNGVSQIENNVIRTNKLINFLSIVSRIPNLANLPELTKEIWVAMGFSESSANKVIMAPNMESVEDVQNENLAMQLGQIVKVQPNENHMLHVQVHGKFLEELRATRLSTPEVEQIFKDHIIAHSNYLQAQMGIVNATGGAPLTPEAQMNQMAQNGGFEYPNKDVSTQPMQSESPLEEVAQ